MNRLCKHNKSVKMIFLQQSAKIILSVDELTGFDFLLLVFFFLRLSIALHRLIGQIAALAPLLSEREVINQSDFVLAEPRTKWL